MLFNSYAFLFAFLPLSLAGYFLIGYRSPKAAAGFLALMSLCFYGWWSVEYIPLLLASVLFNFTIGSVIARMHKQGRHPLAQWTTGIGVVADLALLGYFKYSAFLVENWHALNHTVSNFGSIVLPLGISFYTFTQIAYLIDTNRGKASEYSFVNYLLFVTYFPHLIAGPILHHKEMMPQFSDGRNFTPRWTNLAPGLTIFFIGLFKKTVIADGVAVYVGPVFEAAVRGVTLTPYEAWGGALAYAIQLYFDFSGYCDMAVGISWMFGIRLPFNFDSPYKARNISDFWRRWHMTLSRFLRDYLYIPLGGNRKGPVRRYVNLLTTMLLGGLWHGAGWGFIVWGFLHGVYLCIHHAWQAATARPGRAVSQPSVFSAVWPVLLTFTAVVFAWVFFRASSVASALSIVKSMLLVNGLVLPHSFEHLLPAQVIQWLSGTGVRFGSTGEYFQSPQQVLWILGGMSIAWLAPNSQELIERWQPRARTVQFDRVQLRPGVQIARWRPNLAWAVGVGALACAGLMSMDRVSEFLYFQF